MTPDLSVTYDTMTRESHDLCASHVIVCQPTRAAKHVNINNEEDVSIVSHNIDNTILQMLQHYKNVPGRGKTFFTILQY